MTPSFISQQTLMTILTWSLIVATLGMVTAVVFIIRKEYKDYKRMKSFDSSLKPGDKAQLLTQHGVKEVEVLSLTDDKVTISMEIHRGRLFPAGTYVKDKKGYYKRAK